MMARARLVRSSFSLGVNRMSPLTQRLISRVAISVMRTCSPRSVMGMTPAISIAFWHSRMDIVGGAGGMRGRSASAMMARALNHQRDAVGDPNCPSAICDGYLRFHLSPLGVNPRSYSTSESCCAGAMAGAEGKRINTPLPVE